MRQHRDQVHDPPIRLGKLDVRLFHCLTARPFRVQSVFGDAPEAQAGSTLGAPVNPGEQPRVQDRHVVVVDEARRQRAQEHVGDRVGYRKTHGPTTPDLSGENAVQPLERLQLVACLRYSAVLVGYDGSGGRLPLQLVGNESSDVEVEVASGGIESAGT